MAVAVAVMSFPDCTNCRVILLKLSQIVSLCKVAPFFNAVLVFAVLQ